MSAWGVADAVLAGSCPAPLEAVELHDQPLVIEQLNTAGTRQWQQAAIQIRFWLLCNFITDAMSLETLARPLAAVMISQDGVNAIAIEQSDELDNDIIRAGPTLTQCTENDAAITFSPCDRQRHAVRRTARRINEPDITTAARCPRRLEAARYHCGFNRLARNEAFDVGAKLRQIRGCRGGGIALERPIDDFRRQRRIEIAAGALSNKDLGIALRAVVPVVNAPHLTASCIGRGDGRARLSADRGEPVHELADQRQ
jgi:hypothetical protein